MEETNSNTDSNTDATPSKTSKSNPMMMVGVVAVLLLGGAGFFLMGGNKNTVTTMPEVESNVSVSEAPVASSAASESDIKTITLEAGSFCFKPNEIRVKKGEKVRIEMTAADMMHDFNIEELGVKMPITKSGEKGVVEFTPSEVGEFEFYCSVGQHRANGQTGILIVE